MLKLFLKESNLSREEQHIVPTFRLSPFQALSPFIRITPQKNCPHSLDFKLVPVYWKNGDNFFRSDSDIRKSNVIMKHEWPRFYSAGIKWFNSLSPSWTISVSVFIPSCCKGWITRITYKRPLPFMNSCKSTFWKIFLANRISYKLSFPLMNNYL